MNKRIKILIVAASLLFLSGQIFAANAISVSKIDGLDTTNSGLMSNTPIRYYLRFQVGDFGVNGMVNPFKVYSPDSANWQPLVPTELFNADSLFDGLSGFFYGSVNGMGADTIAVHGFSISSPGLVPGFDEDYFFIETLVSEEEIGKTLCLDSSFLHPNQWLWSSDVTKPAWDGPHCHEIVDCCIGHRGDINGDGKGPNILDLTRLVDYIFRGSPAPDCQLESDVNSDGLPSRITDLTYIVDYMHRGGPLPGSCPAD